LIFILYFTVKEIILQGARNLKKKVCTSRFTRIYKNLQEFTRRRDIYMCKAYAQEFTSVK